MLDLWLDQEAQIEKTAAQQFEEMAEKIAVAGPAPEDHPFDHEGESGNYSEVVKSPEAADRMLERELTGRVTDEVPKTNVQQTPPRGVNTATGRAGDAVPTVDRMKKAASRLSRAAIGAGIGGAMGAGTGGMIEGAQGIADPDRKVTGKGIIGGALGGALTGAAAGGLSRRSGKTVFVPLAAAGSIPAGAVLGGAAGAALGQKKKKKKTAAKKDKEDYTPSRWPKHEQKFHDVMTNPLYTGIGGGAGGALAGALMSSKMRGAGLGKARIPVAMLSAGLGGAAGGAAGGLINRKTDKPLRRLSYKVRPGDFAEVEREDRKKKTAAREDRDGEPSRLSKGLAGAGLGGGAGGAAYLIGQGALESSSNRKAIRTARRAGKKGATLTFLKHRPKMRRAGVASLVGGAAGLAAGLAHRGKEKRSYNYVEMAQPVMDEETGRRHGRRGGAVLGGILGAYGGMAPGLLGRRPDPGLALAGGLLGAAGGAGLGYAAGGPLGAWGAREEADKYKGNLIAKRRMAREVLDAEKEKSSSLRETMMKVAAEGKVQTMEEWR